MPKYRIENPVAHYGRRERGEVVEAPEGTFQEEDATLIADDQEPQEEEETEEQEETEKLDTEDIDDSLKKDELQEQAELRDLSTTGTKSELIDRIKLHDEEE